MYSPIWTPVQCALFFFARRQTPRPDWADEDGDGGRPRGHSALDVGVPVRHGQEPHADLPFPIEALDAQRAALRRPLRR